MAERMLADAADNDAVTIDVGILDRYVVATNALIADLLEHGPGEHTAGAELLYIAATEDLAHALLGAST